LLVVNFIFLKRLFIVHFFTLRSLHAYHFELISFNLLFLLQPPPSSASSLFNHLLLFQLFLPYHCLAMFPAEKLPNELWLRIIKQVGVPFPTIKINY
jgi:hypothetical protein